MSAKAQAIAGLKLPELRWRPFVPAWPAKLKPGVDMFERLRAGDLLLHHPFESFEPVIEFLPGWKCPTAGAKTFSGLPPAARRFVRRIEECLALPVAMISAGKDRAQLIVRRPAFGKS